MKHTDSLSVGYSNYHSGLVCKHTQLSQELPPILHILLIVSQAIPFAERGRVWSRCNYRVVAEECNHRPLRLGNKMLTPAKHVVT